MVSWNMLRRGRERGLSRFEGLRLPVGGNATAYWEGLSRSRMKKGNAVERFGRWKVYR